jgi:hypothetical protein
LPARKERIELVSDLNGISFEQDDLIQTSQMEVLMPTITLTVTKDHLARMMAIAESFNVTIEELVYLSIEDLLSRHDEAFHNGAEGTPSENKELG